ncbi:MAG TPA: Omp28-related outer membrane protein [Ignavibacteria bacterium]|nr:Omp28-related outer membrane protein [Ignavibacteria bacterium]HMR41030.1 Omp28-related outer membrane protein [Ignavibacteria bacterium]
MKKILLSLAIVITFVSFSSQKAVSQTGYNSLLEYCTGTWCQWCPCGHDNIEGILANYPNTVVLSYHGAGSDPWQSYSAGIRGLFGFSSYPSGVVNRKTGIISYSAWNNEVVLQTLLTQPTVSIEVNNKSYDANTRTITANVVLKALTDLTGDYYVNFVLTESNLIYSQTGNATCTGASNYVHTYVVKSMINGDLGESVVSGNWVTGQEVSKNLSYVIPDNPVVLDPGNCDINIFVYKQGTSIGSNYNVQQSMRTSVTGTTGINNLNSIATEYKLSQNYPNPFNPTTNFNFTIPKNENVSLKIYDVLGNEVETLVDGQLNAGTYGVEFDGSKYASGIYFYRLSSGNFVETKRMNLIK